MNMKAVWTITNKDIKAISSNSQVWVGLIILPVVFAIFFPLVFILAIKYFQISSPEIVVIVEKIMGGLPNGKVKDYLNSLPSLNHQMIYVVINYLLGSMFLLIPVINSMMIALNSFAGEKEKRTLETLLFAPITVTELFVGKILSAFIPTMILTFASFLIFGIITTVLTYPMFNELIFPSLNWIILVFWVAPIITIFTILVEVFVSARAKGFQEAQQLGGLIILPIFGLFVSQATGFLIISPLILVIIGIVLLVICFVLLKIMTKFNSRNVLFERQI